jgi:phosphatidate cytidylyltransferase
LAAASGPTMVVATLGLACVAIQTVWIMASVPGSRTSFWTSGIATTVSAGLPFAMLVLLRNANGPPVILDWPVGSVTLQHGAAWVAAVLTATWAVDTFAYAIGRAAGTRPFSRSLSPKKTWEGTLGGVIAGTLVLAAWAAPFGWHFLPAVAAGILLSIAAIAGDLAESALKRSAGVKDSGSLLPGHGGLLDRIDSLAFSVVVVFLLKALDDSLHVLRWL